jgi:hypothetical protein
MHGKLMPAHNSDMASGCEKQGQPVTRLLCGICPVPVTIRWVAVLLYFWEDLTSDLILETSCYGKFSVVFFTLSNQA